VEAGSAAEVDAAEIERITSEVRATGVAVTSNAMVPGVTSAAATGRPVVPAVKCGCPPFLDSERAGSFGALAEEYDRCCLAYPCELIGDPVGLQPWC
jgi:hypothetical protein